MTLLVLVWCSSVFFFFSSRRRHTRSDRDWSSDVCSSDLGARRLGCDRTPYALEIGDGQRLPARAVIIATGAEYRRLPIDGLPRFEGAGVYYAATFMEAQLCAGDDVVVVGAGNSAGPAPAVLAQSPRRGPHLVRPPGLPHPPSRHPRPPR